MFRSIPVAVLAVFAVLPSFGQDKKKPAPKNEPRVILAVPLGAAPGKTTRLTLRGAHLEDATDVKVATGKGSVKILGKGKAAVPDKNPDKVGDAKTNPKAIGWFVGQVMKASGGKANPQAVNELLKKRLGI